MFSDLAVAHGIPVRRWVPLVSFSLQAAMIATALAYPLLRMQSLPPVPHPLSLPIFEKFAPVHPITSVMHSGGGRITAPVIVHSQTFSFHAGPNSSQARVTGPPTIDFENVGAGENTGSIVGAYDPPRPTVAHGEPNVRTSVMMEGNLIHKVEPQYPAIAKQLHIEGSVIIQAWISRDGLIERAQVVSGHPLLTHAALDAVRQWRYRPYYLNHEPVEVETEITVNFIMHR